MAVLKSDTFLLPQTLTAVTFNPQSTCSVVRQPENDVKIEYDPKSQTDITT